VVFYFVEEQLVQLMGKEEMLLILLFEQEDHRHQRRGCPCLRFGLLSLGLGMLFCSKPQSRHSKQAHPIQNSHLIMMTMITRMMMMMMMVVMMMMI